MCSRRPARACLVGAAVGWGRGRWGAIAGHRRGEASAVDPPHAAGCGSKRVTRPLRLWPMQVHPAHWAPAGSAGARLPPRCARRRARVPRHVRPVAGRRHLHAGLRRGGHRGPLRAPQRPHVVPPEAAAERAHVPGAAPALPLGDRVVRPVVLRPRGVELERLGARRDLRRGHRARLLLLQPVPLRVERPRPHAGRAARPGDARDAARAVPPLAPVGLDRRPARRSLRRRSRAPRSGGSPPTSGASRTSSTRRWTRAGSRPGPSATTTSCSRS